MRSASGSGELPMLPPLAVRFMPRVRGLGLPLLILRVGD